MVDDETAREKLARRLGEAWITSGPRAWEEQSEGRRAGARHLADALLPVVREIVAEELRGAATAWDEGHAVGWEHCQDGNYGNDYWDDDTPNPYRADALHPEAAS